MSDSPQGREPVLRSPVVNCKVTLTYLTAAGTTMKTTNYKAAKILLGRNQFRDIMLHIDSGTESHQLPLRNFELHKRFLKEGKATIALKDMKINVMISNAPPNILLVLLKTLAGKQGTADKENRALVPSAIRQRLLSTEPNRFDEISPLTVKEYQSVRGGGKERQLELRAANASATASPVSSKRKRCPSLQSQCTPPSKRAIISSRAPAPALIRLNAAQTRVMRAVQAGHNVFFTGSAGTGKSFLLRRLVGCLPPDATAVTASTGVAACHLSGTTLHAFAGMGNGDAPLEQCVQRAQRAGSLQQWRRCRHLIIDEVSMVDGDFFEKVEAVARAVLNNDKPFGGIQLILCGDFLQLPPVTRGDAKPFFAFQTDAWQRCITCNIELTDVRRQDDAAFIDILQEIRQGRCSPNTLATLRNTSMHQLSRDGILATRLCTHREDAEHINAQRLDALPGNTRVFTAVDTDPCYTSQLNSQTPVLATIMLKEGAQVMLMKNLSVSEGLVNGARGVVKKFSADGLPVVQFVCGVQRPIQQERWAVRGAGGMYLSRRQLPLKLAWAFSIHKSQGMTLDLVEMSLSRVFEAGQAYVALSRAKNLAGLRVLDLSSSAIRANKEVLEFYSHLSMSDL